MMLSVEQLMPALERLSKQEKILVIERLEGLLKQADDAVEIQSPLKTLYGLAADLGPAPSEEDLDEVRREMMKNFPREDIM